jgi:hypothetical protein
MYKRLLTAILSMGLLLGPVAPIHARRYHHSYRRRGSASRRIGTGAAGGAAIGAIAGRGVRGAAIGGIIGAGAGSVYNSRQRRRGR